MLSFCMPDVRSRMESLIDKRHVAYLSTWILVVVSGYIIL